MIWFGPSSQQALNKSYTWDESSCEPLAPLISERNEAGCRESATGSAPWYIAAMAIVTRRDNLSTYLEQHLVNVTPTPVFPWLKRLYDWMVGRMKMFSGVLVFRRIASLRHVHIQGRYAGVPMCLRSSSSPRNHSRWERRDVCDQDEYIVLPIFVAFLFLSSWLFTFNEQERTE